MSIGQFPSETFPGMPDYSKNALDTFNQMIQARQQQEQQSLAQRGQQIPGRVGQPGGAPGLPQVAGVTSGPGGMPGGMPGGGGGVPATAPGGGAGGAGGVAGTRPPINMGSTGNLPSLSPKFVGTAAPEIPYNTQQYATGRQRNQQVIANSLAGVFNAVQQRKDTNEKKQFQEAENTYAQLVAAQQALQKNPNDPNALAAQNAILTDPKKLKILEDSLGYYIPKEPGGETDSKKAQSPAVQGAQSFWKKFGQRLEQGAQQTFDPRTAAQRQFGGANAPSSGPGTLPAPNTPGGVIFGRPQQSDIDARIEQRKREILADHPEYADQIAKQDLKIIPGPEVQSRNEIRKQELAARTAHWDQVNSQNVAKQAEVKRMDDMRYQMAEDRIAAYTAANKARLGEATATEVQTWATRYQRGDVLMTQIPKNLKTPVLEATAGLPIAKKLLPQQQLVMGTAQQMAPILDSFSKSLNRFIELNPDAENDIGLAGVENWAEAKMAWGKYSLGAEPEAARAELIKQAAALSIMGAGPWIQIGRGKYTLEQIRAHLPAPGDTPAKMRDNAQFLGTIRQDAIDEINMYRWGGEVGRPPTGMTPQQMPGTIPQRPADMVITPEMMNR